MHPALLLAVVFPQTGPSLATLNDWARLRNATALRSALVPLPAGTPDPVAVLRTNGAYGVGEKGWRAEEANGWVVLTTPLTSQDVGDLVFRREGDKLRYIPETDSLGVKPLRHRIDLKFDLPGKRAILEDRMILEAKGTGPWLMRFSPNYRIASVTDGSGKAFEFFQLGGVAFFPVRPSGKFGLTIRYAGVVDLPKWAGSISNEEASLTNDYWYGMIARHPAPYDLRVEVPAGWTAVGQGERVSERVNGGVRETVFRMDLPVVYYSFAAGPYRSISARLNGNDYRMWSPRLPEARMKLQPELYRPIWEFFSAKFGKPPFRGYGALDSPAYGGGALEAYSYATWGGGLPFEDAHEPAHTWWGGMINNTYLKSFWNESFAVYSDGLYMRNVPLGNVSERRRAYVSDSSPNSSYDRVAVAEGGAFAGPFASSLGYGKGAKVLQMMEQILGTDRMIRTMRTWVETHPKGEPGEWEDFERVANRIAPEANLEAFFRDWLRKPGTARLRVDRVGYESGDVVFQTRFEGEGFDMPLEVMVETPDGKRRTEIVRIKAGTVVRIPSATRPSVVRIDPFNVALRDKKPDERPVSIEPMLRSGRRVVDAKSPFALKLLQRGVGASAIPADPNGQVIFGHPDTLPGMRGLLDKAGLKVTANQLTFDGTKVDLREGGALAVVELGEGKRCLVGIGTVDLDPNPGNARLMVFDRYGRMLRGRTDPGGIAFRL